MGSPYSWTSPVPCASDIEERLNGLEFGELGFMSE
jgi:hypothetical protein